MQSAANSRDRFALAAPHASGESRRVLHDIGGAPESRAVPRDAPNGIGGSRPVRPRSATARRLQPRVRRHLDGDSSIALEEEGPMSKTPITAALVVLLAPALLLAQKVSYDYNKAATFTAFKTYAHKDGTKVGQPLIDQRIVTAIEAELAAKGLTKAESNPDLFVVYHIAFDKEKDISTYSSGYGGGYGPYGWGWGGGWGGGMTTTQVRDILIGTLVIDLADAKAGQLAWRGMGVKEVDTQAKPEKRDKSIANAVKKIFKNYPPKTT
jgi:hypothetical protein